MPSIKLLHTQEQSRSRQRPLPGPAEDNALRERRTSSKRRRDVLQCDAEFDVEMAAFFIRSASLSYVALFDQIPPLIQNLHVGRFCVGRPPLQRFDSTERSQAKGP